MIDLEFDGLKEVENFRSAPHYETYGVARKHRKSCRTPNCGPSSRWRQKNIDDLTYYYKQCIDGMDEIRREAWSLYKYGDWSQGVHLTVKEKIAALKLLEECDEAKFALLEKGHSVLNVKGMVEKLDDIQNKQIVNS